jgi:hypothetical protein
VSLPDGVTLASEEHVEFCFLLSALLDQRWPLVSRFGVLRTPRALAEHLQAEVSLAFVVSLEPGVLAGFVGMSAYDPDSGTSYLEAVSWPTAEAEARVSEVIPWLLKTAFSDFGLQRVYLESYVEAPALALRAVPDGWNVDVSIPEYISLPGRSWTLQTLGRGAE